MSIDYVLLMWAIIVAGIVWFIMVFVEAGHDTV